jgi:hypothetical protein
MNPIDAYQMFTAVKLHFTSDGYDYFRYHGKVRVDADKFETRRDKYHYYKLTKAEDPLMLCVTSCFHKSNLWIGDLFTSEAKQRLRERKAALQSIDYRVTTELSQYESYEDALNVVGGEYPKLLSDYREGKVSMETLIIVNFVNGRKVFDYWTEQVDDPVVWPDLSRRLTKYEPFLGKEIINKERWLTSIKF